MIRIYSLALCLLLTSTAFAGKATISKDEFGQSWPFTVEEAELECDPPNHLTLSAAGKRYAIISNNRPDDWPWPNEIIASYPNSKVKMQLGPIIFRGLRLCRQP